jgi:hypothetical protein
MLSGPGGVNDGRVRRRDPAALDDGPRIRHLHGDSWCRSGHVCGVIFTVSMLHGALHRLRSIRVGSRHLKPASATSVQGLTVDLG